MIGENAKKKKEYIKSAKLLLKDDKALENFIKLNELSVQNAPADFVSSVMQKIYAMPIPEIKDIANPVIPALSRKLCATVCFCSAAVILISTATGFYTQIYEFILNSSGKLNEISNLFLNYKS